MVGNVEGDLGGGIGQGDAGHKGVQQAAAIGGGLLIVVLAELFQQEQQLLTGEAGRLDRRGEGIQPVQEVGFLLFELLEAGDEAGTAAVLDGAQEVGLLCAAAGQLGGECLTLWIGLGLILLLQEQHLVHDLLHFVRIEHILGDSAGDQVFNPGLFHGGFGAAIRAATGTDIVIVLAASVTGAARAFEVCTAHGAGQLAGENIIGTLTDTAAMRAVLRKLFLAAVEQVAVDHGGDSSFDADVCVLINANVHLIGDDTQDGIFIERVAPAGADAVCVEMRHDLSGGMPGGILLKDIPHGGSLRGVDDVLFLFADVVAEAAVPAKGFALKGAFALTTAQLLGQLGAIIFCEGLHETLQNDAFRTVYDCLCRIQDLDSVLAQAVFIDRTIIAVTGKSVGLPADQGIEFALIAVGDHLLEGGAAIGLAGDMPVDIFVLDDIAMASGIRFAVAALTLDTLLVLAGTAGKAIVRDQTHLGGCSFFTGHECTLLSVARLLLM